MVTEITDITDSTGTEFTGPTTITRTIEYEKTSGEDAAATPVRKKTIRTKVDSSKFLTPYLQHSNKMKDLFSEVNCPMSFTCLETPILKASDRYCCDPLCYFDSSCTPFHHVSVLFA